MTVIIATRDPDYANQYAVFAEMEPEPRIVDVDYGASDLTDRDEFLEWRDAHLATVRELREDGSPSAARAAEHLGGLVAEAAENYGHEC